jgi:hypothetical protein
MWNILWNLFAQWNFLNLGTAQTLGKSSLRFIKRDDCMNLTVTSLLCWFSGSVKGFKVPVIPLSCPLRTVQGFVRHEDHFYPVVITMYFLRQREKFCHVILRNGFSSSCKLSLWLRNSNFVCLLILAFRGCVRILRYLLITSADYRIHRNF